MPPPAPALLDWTGFYVGLQGGLGLGSSNEHFLNAPNTAAFDGTQRYDLSGGFAGGQVGYNYQISSFVVGVQGDYNWAMIDGRSSVINVTPNLGDTYFSRLSSYGDVKGRVGYVTGPVLLFVAGGLAFGTEQHRYDAAGNGGAGNSFSSNSGKTGYTVGAGVEYKFAQHWTAGLEYDYVNLGKSSISYTAAPNNRSTWEDDFSLFKATVAYHF